MPRARSLIRHTAWNLAGLALPLALAVATTPALIRQLGMDRFGFLSIAWMLVGYFSFFDLGLGRALTNLAARELGRDPAADLAPLVWPAIRAMAILGAAGGVVVALIASVVVRRVLQVPPALEGEAVAAMMLLAASLPLVVVSSGLRGVLEAGAHFGASNRVRIGLGAVTFLGPLLASFFTPALSVGVATLVAGRLLAAAAYLVACRRHFPSLRRWRSPSGARQTLRQLLAFGGWMTVSNVVSPLMTSMDRFVIGTVLSLTQVTLYVSPYEVVTKVLIIPSAVAATLFPEFSARRAAQSAANGAVYRAAVTALTALVVPVCFGFIALAHPFLGLWLGPEFQGHSVAVMRILAIGVLMNALASVPFARVQGEGRPDLTAKLHLVEMPLYVGALLVLIHRFGIVGAAAAWAGRAVLDAVLLHVVSERLAAARSMTLRRFVAPMFAAIVLAVAVAPLRHPALLLLAGAAAIAAVLVAGWHLALSGEDRAFVRARVRSPLGRSAPPAATAGRAERP